MAVSKEQSLAAEKDQSRAELLEPQLVVTRDGKWAAYSAEMWGLLTAEKWATKMVESKALLMVDKWVLCWAGNWVQQTAELLAVWWVNSTVARTDSLLADQKGFHLVDSRVLLLAVSLAKSRVGSLAVQTAVNLEPHLAAKLVAARVELKAGQRVAHWADSTVSSSAVSWGWY